MRLADAFLFTVGVLLAESYPALPWREPLPPALLRARGWYLPTRGGPLVLFVLAVDGEPDGAIASAIEAWQLWLPGLRANESVLLLVSEQGGPSPVSLPEASAWPIWWVDLAAGSVGRAGVPDEARPFAQTVDSLIGGYFKGARYTERDLAEQEQARVEGKVPFFTFLDGQKSPATFALLVVIGGFFVMTQLMGGSENMEVLMRAGANVHPLIQRGEWWRLVTANFLHIGYAHLAVNAYSLFAVGPMLEKLFGTAKFLAIYIFAGLTGALLSFFFNVGGVSAGASGALFGLIGAMLVLGLRHSDAIPEHEKKRMRNVSLVTLAINLAIGFQIQGIDNYCHLGGLVGGAALGALLGPHPELLGQPSRPWHALALAIVPAIAALALAYGLVYTLGGHVPVMSLEGPTHDFVVDLPVASRAYGRHSLYVSKDDKQQLVLTSIANPYTRPIKALPPLTTETLGRYAYQLADRLTAADKVHLVGEPLPFAVGTRHYLKMRVGAADGTIEEAYFLVRGDRLYLIRTKGLERGPWVRNELDHALGSFEPTIPKKVLSP